MYNAASEKEEKQRKEKADKKKGEAN